MRVLNAAKGLPITGLAYAPDGLTLVGTAVDWKRDDDSSEVIIWFWDIATGAEARRYSLDAVCAMTPRLSFTPNGTKLAVWSGPSAILDLTKPNPAENPLFFDWLSSEDSGVCFGNDGRVVHGVPNQQLVAVDSKTGAKRKALSFPLRERDGYRSPEPDSLRRAAHVERFALAVMYLPPNSPDAWKPILGTLVVRDVKSGRVFQLAEWRVPSRLHATHFELNADGTQVAVLCGTRLRVWGVDNATELTTIRAGRKTPNGFAFSSDGRYLGVLYQGTVSLYDTISWTVTRTYSWKVGKLRSIAFSPDGATAAVGSDKGKVVVFDLE